MDYRKVDAGLASALEFASDGDAPSLQVFIHTSDSLDEAQEMMLADCGVRGAKSGRKIYTATLSPSTVARLSDQPWVEYIRSAQRMRLLGG